MASQFGPQEDAAAERLIRLAIAEDLPRGDVTSSATIPAAARVRGVLSPREPGVVCGIPVVAKLFSFLDPRIACRPALEDGEELQAGRPFLEVEGPACPILAGERTALNFIQRLSGIATRTRRWKEALEGTEAVLLDTRKTVPGWRALEKYAVRSGGGVNHRASLSDMAMLKDNHVQILRRLSRGGPREWVQAIRERWPGVPVELEVDGLEELREALESGADLILLDNMDDEEMTRAVNEARARPGPCPLLEASGGIEAGRLRDVARTGVDRISAGALTHSAEALDIGFDLLEVSLEDEDR